MKFKSNNLRLQYDSNRQPEIVLSTTGNVEQEVEELKQVVAKGKLLQVEVKQLRVKRSLDSNSYAWILCQKIAEVIHSTKELVYQKVIRDVGQFELVPIKDTAVNRWIEVWNSKGLGWFSEVLEDSKLAGYKKVISYYGSSVYSNIEMGIVIDELVSTCKELNIETMNKADVELLKTSWGK